MDGSLTRKNCQDAEMYWSHLLEFERRCHSENFALRSVKNCDCQSGENIEAPYLTAVEFRCRHSGQPGRSRGTVQIERGKETVRRICGEMEGDGLREVDQLTVWKRV